jgi:hypothetical protein
MASYRLRSDSHGIWALPVSLSILTRSREHSIDIRSIAVPAVVVGIILGPVAAKFIEADKWGAGHEGQTRSITLVSLLLWHLAVSKELTIIGRY